MRIGSEPILASMIRTEAAPGFRSLGQATARAIVERASSGGRLQRTLLVHGPAAAGKHAFVDDLLALALCTDPDVARRPCNACRGCADARARIHPDLVVGSPDAWREARSTGESIVAAARRWLLDTAGAPIAGERRVIVIERADQANEQTQNALLKALEEPTARHMFILVADEPSRLLPTIRSRCQPLRVGPVPRDELVAWLVDRERLPADQADVLAALAGGLAGAAVEFVRRPELLSWRRRIQAELIELLGRGSAERFAAVRELLDETTRAGVAGSPRNEPPPEPGDGRVATAVQRGAALQITEAWLGLARDMIVAAAGRPELAPAAEIIPQLPEVAAGIGVDRLMVAARRLERVHAGLLDNAAPRLALEAAMLAWPST
jgi:hypothetical protein